MGSAIPQNHSNGKDSASLRRWLRSWRRLFRARRKLGRFPHIQGLLALYVPLLIVVVTAKAARIGGMQLTALETLDFLRSEVFLILAVFLLWAGLVLASRRGYWRGLAVIGGALFWVIIGTTELLGTGYSLTTGDYGFSYPFFVYGLKKIPAIAPMVSAEASTAALPLMAVAAMLILLASALVHVARRTRTRRRHRHRPNRRLGRAMMLAAPLALVLAILPSFFSDDVLMSRAITINASEDAVDLLSEVKLQAKPIRPTYPLKARLAAAAPAAGTANLVIILLESTRAKSVTVYNPELATTPYLAELAKTSIVARRAYAFTPQTSKALVSTLCGLENFLRRGVREAQPNLGIPGRCLAGLLRDAGYRTVFFQSATKTFEHRDGLVANMGYAEFYSGDEMPSEGLQKANYFGFEDRIMLGPSRRWLKKNGDRPFFATYMTNTPHHPYLAPTTYGRKPFAADDELNRYLNSINYLDHFVKELIAQYKELGLYDNTVFIIMGDHGEGFGEHGVKQHITTIYDEGLHIPLLIHDGRNPKAGEITQPVWEPDVMPTALELLGFRIENGVYPGRSMFAPPIDRAIMSHCWRERQCMSVIRGPYKLIYHFDNRPDELFDLVRDPGETRNLAAEMPERAKRMRKELIAWRIGVLAYYKNYYRARRQSLKPAS